MGKMTKKDLLIIMPAYNEEQSLEYTLELVRTKAPYADILVVDDCSQDNTYSIACGIDDIAVITLPINLGVGGAMRAGFAYADRYGYKWAVQLDSDGQHDPAYIEQMLQKAKAEGADIVIGARFAGVGDYKVRGPRWWAMRLLATVLSLQTKVKLTDVTSGYKLYSRKALEFYKCNYPAEYLGDTIEALALASKAGLKIVQVPVKMNVRYAGVPSHGGLKSAIFLFRAMLALFVALIVPGKKNKRK